MSISVLPQLLEVDSELSAQAIALEAKLSELQEKRRGIQTVISLFESNEPPADADMLAATPVVTDTPTTTKTATKKTAAGTKTTGKRKATKATATQSTAAKTTKTQKASPKAVAKKTAAKTSGRTADWQRYIQGAYKKSPLPDVVVGVLQAQPSNIFKIADVMSAVFKEDMPKSHFLKARNRISNILSAGARDGVWHRGRGGTYSMSEKVIKA